MRTLLLPGLLAAILVLGNVVWFQLGDHPQHWDSAIHLSESLNADRIGIDPSKSELHQALNVSWYYPPFVSYASMAVYGMLGESVFAGMQVMTLFLVILVLSVYATGKELFGSAEGLVGAALIASCPIVIRYSHMFMLDMPLAAMVALSLYVLIRTDSFNRRIASAVLGLALGAGTLTKWTFPVFLIVPVLYAALSGPWQSPDRWRRPANFAITLSIAAVVAAPWYLVHAIQILSSRGGELGRGADTMAGSIPYYLRIIPEQVSWFMVPLVIGGTILALVKYRFRVSVHFLSFAGGYLFLTLIGFKEPRFSIPLLVPLSVMAAAGLLSWVREDSDRPWIKWGLTSALAVLPLIQFLGVSFIPPESPIGERLSRAFLSIPIVNVDGPIHADWQQDSIAVAIDRDREKRGAERAIVRVIPDYVYFNNATISYAVKLGQYPLVVLGTSGFPLFTDYVVLKSGNTGDDSSARDRLRGEILSGASSAKGMYNILARWPLPDGSEAMLIRVEPKPATGVPARTIEEKVRLHADQFVKKYFRPVGGYTLTVSAIDSSETVKGHLKGITVAFDDAECGDFAFNPTGLPVRNVRFEISDLRFDPGRLVSDDTLLLVSIGGLSVKNFTVTAAALRTYAEQSSDGAITVDSLSVGSGAIHFAGSSRGFGPKIGFDLELYSFGHENIWFTFESLRLGGIPIPAFLVNVMSSSFNPVLSGLERLSEVHLGTLALEDNQIRVGG